MRTNAENGVHQFPVHHESTCQDSNNAPLTCMILNTNAHDFDHESEAKLDDGDCGSIYPFRNGCCDHGESWGGCRLEEEAGAASYSGGR